jgi:hypothetical protein
MAAPQVNMSKVGPSMIGNSSTGGVIRGGSARISKMAGLSQQYTDHKQLCEARVSVLNSALRVELQSGPVRVLDMRENYVGSGSGFQVILEYIQSSTMIEEIDLSGNYLTTDNIRLLCEVLRNHPSVHTLRLNDNRLYIESGKELVRLARFNPRMMKVEVTNHLKVSPTASDAAKRSAIGAHNRIPEKILAQMDGCLTYNRNKKQLALAKQQEIAASAAAGDQ